MAELIYWISVFLLFYVYFAYLILCIILGELFKKRIEKADVFPYISVIVACYNEESCIRSKLDNLLTLDYPKEKLQVMIASESTDKTNDIAVSYKDRRIELYAYNQRQGKTSLLYNTVPHAKGEVLLFSDANVLLKQDCLKKIARNFHDLSVGAVTGAVIIRNPHSSSISWGENIYKVYESALRRANSNLGAVLNPDGAIFALRKELYQPISPERGDDFELVIRVLLSGKHSLFEPEAQAYEDASVKATSEVARKVRMVSWFLKSAFILLKEALAKFNFTLVCQIISHKLLRWFSPYFLIAVFITNIILLKKGLFFKSSLVMQAVFYISGLSGLLISFWGRKKAPVFIKAASYFLIFNYAFLAGTIKGVFSGHPSAAWEKTRE
jgi:poly-beta-1,6-N-acetyl-D-glucosamine synthase